MKESLEQVKHSTVTGSRIEPYDLLILSIAYARDLNIVISGGQYVKEEEEW